MALARGIPVGYGNIVNLTTNVFYTIPAGFTISIDHASQAVPVGHTDTELYLRGLRTYNGSFAFREHDPAIMADLLGGTVVDGSSGAVRQLSQFTGTVDVSHEVELPSTVDEVLSNEFALLVTTDTGEVLTAIEGGSPTAAQVSYTDGDATLTFSTGGENDGKRVHCRWLSESVSSSRFRFRPSPTVAAPTLKLFAALRLKEPYSGAEVNDAFGVLIKSATIDGTLGPFGASIGDTGLVTVPFRADFLQEGDIEFFFSNAAA